MNPLVGIPLQSPLVLTPVYSPLNSTPLVIARKVQVLVSSIWTVYVYLVVLTPMLHVAGTDVASSVQCHVEEPSVPLMDFDTPVPNLISECNGSPPQSFQSSMQSLSPLPSALLRTPKKAIDVPTAQLLSITPARGLVAVPFSVL